MSLSIAGILEEEKPTSKSLKRSMDVENINSSGSSTLKSPNISHYQLVVDFEEGIGCENVMSLEYQCSEYSLSSECKSACGIGTKMGSCQWLHENRYVLFNDKVDFTVSTLFGFTRLKYS